MGIARPSKVSKLRQARTIVSRTASSASETDPGMRSQYPVRAGRNASICSVSIGISGSSRVAYSFPAGNSSIKRARDFGEVRNRSLLPIRHSVDRDLA
jgi:hypothetical protein